MNKNNIQVSNSIKSNLVYAFVSNTLVITSSLLLVFLLPKFFGVVEYSYWQLYIFYGAYIGFFQFGWNDGIYLKYGGIDYNNLDKKIISSQFKLFILFQLLIGILIFIFSIIFVTQSDKQLIVIFVSVNLIFVNCKSMLGYVLQATNKIRLFSKINIIDRGLFIFLVITFLFLNNSSYITLIVIDVFIKIFSFALIVYSTRDIVFIKTNFKVSLSETFDSIKIGINLMLSNIASMLLIGSVRFIIESKWGIETFGKVSLTLSISGLLIIFLNSVAIVIFPILKRLDVDKKLVIYKDIKVFITTIIFLTMISYYPIRYISSIWLPEYSATFKYMALLFPMVLFEGKQAILINPYMKALREEKAILRINISVLIISFVMSMIFGYVLHNLDLLVINILFSISLRTVLMELYLSKKLMFPILKNVFVELFLVLIFVFTSWFIDSWISTIIYFVILLPYLILNRKEMVIASKKIKLLR